MRLGYTALKRAAERGDVAAVTQALQKGDININAKDYVRVCINARRLGQPPLMRLVLLGILRLQA
jgi:hypothetical protein